MRFQCLLLPKATPLTIMQYIECNQAMTSSSSNTLRQRTSCLHVQEKEELRIMGYAVGLVYKSVWRSAPQHRNKSSSISTHTTLSIHMSGNCRFINLQSASSGPPGYSKSGKCTHPDSDHRKWKGGNETYFVWCTKCATKKTLCALSLKGNNVGDLKAEQCNK